MQTTGWLGHVSPRLAEAHIAYLCCRHAILLGERTALGAVCPGGPYLANRGRVQFRVEMVGAGDHGRWRQPPLSPGVTRVVGLCAKKQVARGYARRIIAPVTYAPCTWRRSGRDGKRDSGRSHGGAAPVTSNRHHAVRLEAGTLQAPAPEPAVWPPLHLGVESRDVRRCEVRQQAVRDALRISHQALA